MTGTPSLRTTSAVLPSCRRTAPQASTEPIASPSGRACEVSTKRWFSATVLSTSCSMILCGTADLGCALLLCSLLHPPQQLIDARFVFHRTIVVEQKLRHAAQPERDLDGMADISLRLLQTFHRQLSFFFRSLHFHIDARQLAAGLHYHLAHRSEANARIGQLALEQRADLIAQGF